MKLFPYFCVVQFSTPTLEEIGIHLNFASFQSLPEAIRLGMRYCKVNPSGRDAILGLVIDNCLERRNHLESVSLIQPILEGSGNNHNTANVKKKGFGMSHSSPTNDEILQELIINGIGVGEDVLR